MILLSYSSERPLPVTRAPAPFRRRARGATNDYGPGFGLTEASGAASGIASGAGGTGGVPETDAPEAGAVPEA